MNELMLIPNVNEWDNKSLGMLEQAEIVSISNPIENEQASELLRIIKAMQYELKKAFEPAKDYAHKAHKSVTELEKKHLKPLIDAEHVIKSKISSFLIIQEQKRIKEQEKLNAKAEKSGKVANIVPTLSKPEGITMTETWSAEVVDFMALIKSVAKGEVASACLLPNQSLLDQQARSLKGELAIQGVKAVSKKSVSATKLCLHKD